MRWQSFSLTVSQEDAGARLDVVLAKYSGLSRRRVRKAVEDGGVYVGKQRCHKLSKRVHEGERVRCYVLEDERIPPFTHNQILWQEGPLFAVHKRCGQYAQPALHQDRWTLAKQLARHLALGKEAARSLQPVHRLDRETSGIMLLCLDKALLLHLQQHWHSSANKLYLAVVQPEPDWQEIDIRLPISRTRDAKGCYRISSGGRDAYTHAEVIERRNGRALLHLTPYTGRTHQLRVHLAHVGSPILGDRRYGGQDHARLMLHAYRLSVHPPALPKTVNWVAQPEEDWQW